MIVKDLEATMAKIAVAGKGILAADESAGTITKRFAAVQIESTPDTRRDYRELLLTTPKVNEYLAGVIFFEETLDQKTSQGVPFPELCKKLGILPGIKVDKGLTLLPNTKDENITQGLDGLAERLQEYKKKGACFAKWRAVYAISKDTPSRLAIRANAEVLARYAALCQAAGIVPIVEPEVLIDGDHTIEQCAAVSESVLHCVFRALHKHKVSLEHMILKPSMVIPGNKCTQKATPEQVAQQTLTVLRRTVPAAVPTINFLSGGQTPQEAVANLNAMHAVTTTHPWNISFSYARAVQEPCMNAWRGKASNVEQAQKIFYTRVKLNGLACFGKYTPSMEKELSPA